jgi:hypothetical protein
MTTSSRADVGLPCAPAIPQDTLKVSDGSQRLVALRSDCLNRELCDIVAPRADAEKVLPPQGYHYEGPGSLVRVSDYLEAHQELTLPQRLKIFEEIMLATQRLSAYMLLYADNVFITMPDHEVKIITIAGFSNVVEFAREKPCRYFAENHDSARVVLFGLLQKLISRYALCNFFSRSYNETDLYFPADVTKNLWLFSRAYELGYRTLLRGNVVENSLVLDQCLELGIAVANHYRFLLSDEADALRNIINTIFTVVPDYEVKKFFIVNLLRCVEQGIKDYLVSAQNIIAKCLELMLFFAKPFAELTALFQKAQAVLVARLFDQSLGGVEEDLNSPEFVRRLGKVASLLDPTNDSAEAIFS